ncbi:MAG TPA: insulinase family protein [Blastocatellia bacterium]|nr:insulinase family protein [Blastocatellia bacterium]
MKRSKASSYAVLIALIFAALPGPAWSQSGRGRPRVPNRESAGPPPPPVTVPASAAVAKQEQSGNTSRFLLRNGITVLISEQHVAPIVAVAATFKAGRADEPPSARGVSRLLANGIIHGAGRENGRPTADIRALGGQLTADVSYYNTSFNILVSPEKLPDALAAQSAMLKSPALSDEVLRAVASVDYEGGEAMGPRPSSRPWDLHDDPSAMAMAGLYRTIAPAASVTAVEAEGDGGPSRPTTREQALQFYGSHYRPENLIISVAGDVPTFNTLLKIQQLYADYGKGGTGVEEAGPQGRKQGARSASPSKTSRPAAPAQKAGTDAAGPEGGKPATAAPAVAPAAGAPSNASEQNPPASPQPPGLRYGAERADIGQSVVTVGCRVSGPNPKESAALEVLAAILAEGRSSRLNRPALDGQPSQFRAESDYLASHDEGLLTVRMWMPPNAIDKAESDLFRELDRLRRELVTEAELARAHSLVEKNAVDDLGTYQGRARALAHAEAAGVGFKAALDYRTRIRTVSAQDVQKTAAKYLVPANIAVFEYESTFAPQRTFDSTSFAKAVLAWAPAFGRNVEANDLSEATPETATPLVRQGEERSPEEMAASESVEPLAIKDFSTLNGPRAYVREDHSQPKVTASILFQVGRLGEDEATSGLTELMVQSMLYGTERRTALQVAHEVEQLGGEIQPVSDPDFFGFTLSVLSRNADAALKIVRDIIETPAFRDEDVNRARAVQMGRIRESRDSGLARSHDLLFEGLFAGHPYALPSRGREEAVAKINGEQLRAWHEKVVKRQFPLVVLVGDTQGSALVSSVVAEGFRRRELDQKFAAKVPAPKPSAEKLEQRNRKLSALSLGFAGPKAGSPDIDVIKLIGAALNDSGGRLMAELRDRQALVFAAGLDHEALLTGGAIYLQLLAPAENEARARASALSELDRLARAGLSAEEIQNAVEAAEVAEPARLQHQGTRALEYAQVIFSQKQPSDVDSFIERLSKLTAADVKRVASLYFKPSAASSGVVRGAQRR